MGSWCSKCKSARKKKDMHSKGTETLSDIFSLPAQLREKIWRCLDNETKRRIRQVCSIFKSEIDLGAGLTVDVDGKDDANLHFLHRVEVKKAVVVNWDDSSNTIKIFRCKWNVEYLQVHCVMGQHLFKNLTMPLSENLLSLSLMDRSLMFSSILPHDVAIKASTKTHSGFVFPRLIALEIQYGHFSNTKQKLHVFNFNMITIMKSFYCPRLTCFVVHPDPNILLIMSEFPEKVPKNHVEWENNPLKAFVSLHSESLRLLDLFLYSQEIHEDNYDNYKYPQQLTDFIIVIPFITVAKEFIGQCYWKDLILNSTQLHRLILQIEFWHNYVDFFSIANGIFEQNAYTLTTIRLESFSLEEENYNDQASYARNSIGFTLNFNLFACCIKLKVLEVYQLNSKKNLVAVGLTSLPETLERLEIKRIYVPSEEIYLLRNFPNLQKVLFYHIGTEYFFGVDFKALKKLWGCPKLEVLQVCGFNFKDNKKKMKKFIQKSQDHDVDFTAPGLIVTMQRDKMKGLI